MAVLAVGLLVAAALLALARCLPAYLKFRRLEQAMAGPPSLPVIGNLFDLVGITEENLVARLLKMWGWRTELARVNLVGQLVVFVSDPDHLEKVFKRKDLSDKSRLGYEFLEFLSRNGLVTLNGAEWRAHRRAIQPAFHPDVLDRYVEVFSEEAAGLLSRVAIGGEQDVVDNLRTMSARSFIRTALVSDVDAETEAVLPDVLELVERVTRSVNERTLSPWLWPDAVFRLTAAARAMRRLMAKMDAFAGKVIAGRREHMQRQREAGVTDTDFIKQRRTLLDILLAPDALTLPDSDIVDEFKIFLAAAVETTVAGLCWSLKALAIKPDVQERICQEVENVLGRGVTAAGLTAKDLDKLEYTECVIKETMRLLPAVPVILRQVKEETEFCGRTLPAGAVLALNILGAHRDPRHWPEPRRFDPDRFGAERSQGRHPYAYIPFSAGPRNCIGSKYSMMVMKTVLASLVPRFHIGPVAGDPTEPDDYLPRLTFDIASRMLGGTRVVLTPRTGGPAAAAAAAAPAPGPGRAA